MIFWFTGQPGHGKTVFAIDKLLEYKAQGRLCYVCNVKEFDYAATGCIEMKPEQFCDWMNFLPDGAVALVDEAYEHGMLPKRASGSKVPAHVEQLAKHRHRGLDFIFVCQSPSTQVDSFVHDLIEEHYHVRRRFGLPLAHIRRFDRYERNPDKAAPLTTTRRKYPKKRFALYKSTSIDTSEKRVPWFYWATAALVLFLLGWTWYTVSRVQERLTPQEQQDAAQRIGTSDGASATARGPMQGKDLGTALEYAKLHLPRFETMPWTARAYDDRGITADPHLYCMSSQAGPTAADAWVDFTCTCLTEQGTRYEIDLHSCRKLARSGPEYNPYRKPPERQPPQWGVGAQAPTVEATGGSGPSGVVVPGDVKTVGSPAGAGAGKSAP
ncbi:zonular occludens toxin domain-containing protein [Pseudoxanthomonas mexicana]|uniref:zonular occludens toxin domain-containing protein n=1 Tax=Pseudoxanthomonas mexicana TaxID=128785 RepID=UPI00398AA0BD